MKKTLFLVLTAAALSSCGNYHYEEAEKLRSQGLALAAADQYKLFAETSSSDPRTERALFKAAGIYSREFGLCAKSGPLFEKLLRNYPITKFRREAMRGLLICPDYFPMDTAGIWLYGDSQTGGKNARQEFLITGVAPDKTTAENTFYAGRQLVSRQKRAYSLSGGDLIEKQDGFDTIILRYPLSSGAGWTSKWQGGRLSFKVEAAGLKVKTRAGEFENCVKISRRMAGMSSWIYEYYAPWKGKILTSVGGKGFENRVTELISYEEKTK
ncbi:MAG: hypothetical protein NTX59_02505 [Elusimicrobia bacterium]|nr:hypothetical protein [Elusimicrobiota bacterium]